MALMKSGWLWRQSSILRRWKRNWFVLWLDGGLVYYQDETQRDLEGRIHIKFNCRDIKTGRECRDVQPPEGKSRDCLMTIVLRDGSKVTLCAESEDDAVAWKMAVLEAKNTPQARAGNRTMLSRLPLFLCHGCSRAWAMTMQEQADCAGPRGGSSQPQWGPEGKDGKTCRRCAANGRRTEDADTPPEGNTSRGRAELPPKKKNSGVPSGTPWDHLAHPLGCVHPSLETTATKSVARGRWQRCSDQLHTRGRPVRCWALVPVAWMGVYCCLSFTKKGTGQWAESKCSAAPGVAQLTPQCPSRALQHLVMEGRECSLVIRAQDRDSGLSALPQPPCVTLSTSFGLHCPAGLLQTRHLYNGDNTTACLRPFAELIMKMLQPSPGY
ncbi:pleckstrin homology domain-containing family B member 1 isoform X2 [Chelonia mydas]|nr:pleckstrin homology domain-containing family B member 1 isoform X2 [Chelonia mydas]